MRSSLVGSERCSLLGVDNNYSRNNHSDDVQCLTFRYINSSRLADDRLPLLFPDFQD